MWMGLSMVKEDVAASKLEDETTSSDENEDDETDSQEEDQMSTAAGARERGNSLQPLDSVLQH